MRLRPMPILILILVASLPIAASPVGGATQSARELSQTTVVVAAEADATLRSQQPTVNFGADGYLEISYQVVDEETAWEAATLVRFDLSSLPRGAVVDTADLRMYLSDALGASPVSIAAYHVTSSWTEDEVTWNTSPSSGAYGRISSIDDSTASYRSWDVTPFAQDWVDNPRSNHGVLLRGPTDGTNYERWFESREVMEMVPQLEVTYHLPAYTFSGHVYEGQPPDTSAPVGGVTVELWGDEDKWPEAGFERVLLASTTTSRDGAFGLEWGRESEWPFLHVIEVDPPNAISRGADADPPGNVKNFNVVSYRREDILESGMYDFTGIAFWDEAAEEETPTPSPSPTATETPPPTLDVTLCAVEDAWIHEGDATTNYGEDLQLSVGNGWGQNEPAISRTLMRFDLSWLEPGSEVLSASLEAKLVDSLGVAPVLVDLYAVTDGWDEPNVTWDSQPTVASAPEAQTTVDTSVPAIVSWDVRELVQEWVNGTRDNLGLELRGPETGDTWRRAFESREGTQCPRLVLKVEPAGAYETPTPVPTKTPTPTPTSPCPQPDAAGDSFGTATGFTADGSETAEYLCPSGDVDWWKFHADFGQDIQLWLFDMPYDYDLILFDPDGVEKDSSERWGAENWEYISLTSYKEGHWRALVRGKNAGQWSGMYPYKLKGSLSFTCDPDEAGNTFGSATPLTPTLPQTGIHNVQYGAICPEGDIDFYKFYVPSGETVTISASLTELPADFDLILRQPDTTLVAYSNGAGTSDESITYTAGNFAGEWRVSVYGVGPPGNRTYHNQSYRLEVTLTGNADLTVQGLEMTQAIQDLGNTVDLAAGKRTVGRVYVSGGAGAGDVSGVQVALHGWAVKIGSLYPLPGSPLVLKTGPVSDAPVANDKRLGWGESYNFVLPSSWTTSGSKRFEARVNPDHLIPETDISNNDSTRHSVYFRSNRTLNVGFVPVKASGLVPTLQGNTDFGDMVGWFRAVFPAGDIKLWFKKGGPLDANYDYTIKGSKGCGPSWRKLLSDLDDIYDNWKDRPSNAFVYGLLHSGVQAYWPGCGLTPGHVAGGKLASGRGPTLAHEVGHNFGRKHTPSDPWGNPDCQWPTRVDDGYPYYTSPQGASYNRSSIGEVGVNVYNGTTFDPRFEYDLMSYCEPEWISPYNWEAILSAMPMAQAASAQGLDVPHIVVKGWIDDGDQVDVHPFWIQERPDGAHDEPGSGPYRIELQDGDGTPLFVRLFDIDESESEQGASQHAVVLQTPSTEGYFHEWMPYPAETARIAFFRDDTLIQTVEVSANDPVVTVLSPNGGESWQGPGPYTISWQAYDADDDDLVAHVLYSTDGGKTWEPLAVNVEQEHLEVSGTEIPGSDESLVQVTVSDGVNTSWDRSDGVFHVDAKPPMGFILEPQDGDTFSPGQPVVLAGLATDWEDGPLPEENLSWASDVDGPLGAGNDITVDGLSPGVHQILLATSDSDGMEGSVSVTVFVGHPRVYLPAILRTNE